MLMAFSSQVASKNYLNTEMEFTLESLTFKDANKIRCLIYSYTWEGCKTTTVMIPFQLEVKSGIRLAYTSN